MGSRPLLSREVRSVDGYQSVRGSLPRTKGPASAGLRDSGIIAESCSAGPDL